MSVWITGHMRSGTSMTAGLFERHGVFFGDCRGPSAKNAKGAFENVCLVKAVEDDEPPEGWPEAWFDQLRREGWDGETPWGAKAVAIHHERMVQLEPDVIVLCYRPKEQILASCEAFGSQDRFSREYRGPMIERHWKIMEKIRKTHPGTVVSVDTPDLVQGRYEAIRPAFDALGVTFDSEIADRFIDVDLWHHR